MKNLQDLFASFETAVDAAKAKATDALAQGSAALRSWADWLDAQAAGLKQAGPEDVAKAKAILAKCEAALAPEAHSPKHANGVLLQLVISALAQFVREWLAQQPAA